MKKIYFLVILFIPSVVFSQNWNIINPNYHYHYRNTDSIYITNTIFVDSIQVSGNDTIFFLNRIGTGCDTCSLPPSTYEIGYYLINQPQFLQKTVTKNDSCFIFSDTLNFKIFPHKNIGYTWLFDSIDSISASIISSYSTTTFGIPDSTKTIALSTNDTIILSKNFGIKSFSSPYNPKSYELVGIERPNDTIGIHFPNFWDFYNFDIGDVFQYTYDYGDPAGGFSELYKITILNKHISNDSLFYLVHKVGHKEVYNPEFHYYTYSIDTTLVFINYADSFPNLYNGQICIEPETHEGITGFDDNYIIPICFIDTIDNLITKHNFCDNCYDENSNQVFFPILFEDLWYNYASANIYEFKNDTYNYIFKEGLGLTKKQILLFEQSTNFDLIGYIKNGDTTGTIYSDSYITGINNTNTFRPNFFVYPNPAKNKLTIKTNNFSSCHQKLTITNMVGQTVFEKNITDKGKTELDISSLSKGIYLLRIDSKTNNYCKKIIVE